MCHLNPILPIKCQEEMNPQLFKFHIMLEGTTMATTGAIHLTYNRGQYSHRTLGNEKGACCISTTSRRHHIRTHQAEQTHQSYCILQKSSTTADILRPTGNQLYLHKILTRLLLCEDGTTNFLGTRNEGIDGTTRGCSHQFSKHCIQPISWRLQHASIFITNGKSTELLGHWRM